MSPERRKQRILVTGAAGRIGQYFAHHAADRYELHLLDQTTESLTKTGLDRLGTLHEVDVTDLDALKQVCSGIDTVLHLAGDSSPSAVWSSLLPINIVGTYNVFVAAKAAHCRRVVYASSIHAVSGYPADVQIKPSDSVNPGDLYGVTKCFGEAMARYFAEKEGLSSIVLRIGVVQSDEVARGEFGISMMDSWISERDLQQLIERAIDTEKVTFLIAHGISNNRFKRLDLSETRSVLEYVPVDDLTCVNEELRALRLDEKIVKHNLNDERQKSGIRHELPD